MSQAVQIIEGKAIEAKHIRRDPAGPLTAMDILDYLAKTVDVTATTAKNKAVGLLHQAQFELDNQGNENWALALGLTSTTMSEAANKLTGAGEVIDLIKQEIKPLAQIQRGAKEATKLMTLSQTFLPHVSRAIRAKFKFEMKEQMAEIRQQADLTIDTLMGQKLIGMNADGTIQCTSDAIQSLATQSIVILRSTDDELLTKLTDMKSIKTRAVDELQRVKAGQDTSGFAPLITDTVARSGELQGLQAATQRIVRSDVPNQAEILSEIKVKSAQFSRVEKILSTINL
jgi:hypothetical protein